VDFCRYDGMTRMTCRPIYAPQRKGHVKRGMGVTPKAKSNAPLAEQNAVIPDSGIATTDFTDNKEFSLKTAVKFKQTRREPQATTRRTQNQ
jgi:hypothetical protein